jgi:hypothetical protein
MKTDPSLPMSASPSGQPSWRRFLGWPGTRPSWWSVGLAAAFIILMPINSAVSKRLLEDLIWRAAQLPFYGIFTMLCGLAAGIVDLVAMIRQHERS